MIKAILLATVVPFMAQHRNITPSNEVTTNFYGSVTGVVTRTYIAEHGGGGLEPKDVGLISTNVVTNVVTKAYVEALGISGGGITTNDVNAIIASSNLCTVAAAQAMTNGVATWASGNFLPLYDEYGVYNVVLDTLTFNMAGAVNFKCGSGIVTINPIEESVSALKFYGGSWDWFYVNNQSLPEYISSTSVTNGGAKSYADATFVRANTNAVGTIGKIFTYGSGSAIGVWGSEYAEKAQRAFYVDHVSSIENSSAAAPYKRHFSFGKRDAYYVDGGRLYLYAGDSIVETNAWLSDVKTLSGRTYDFHNGSNFTKNLYIALTNVIQTLGGTVANPPTFD